MQVRRGVRRIGALMLAMLATNAMANFPTAVEVPSAQAQAEILNLLERQALYRDRVDWPATRVRLQSAQGEPAQRLAVLREVIALSTGHHGAWTTAQRQRESLARAQQAGAAAVDRARAADAVDARIGWVVIEGYASTPGATPQEKFRQDIQRAARWQQVIRSKDDGARCGWIVDLRDNGGGAMWPMLLGMAPLLRTSVVNNEDVGSFEAAHGPQRWTLTATAVQLAGKPLLDFGQSGYVLRQPGAPVAVLFGPRTGSSGEASVLAWRGRPQARSFGQPTAGVSTGNVVHTLADGSRLLLTTSVMHDRNDRGDGLKIEPDQRVEGEVATMAAAQAWLLAQPACQGH
ncbi:MULTISPECIES: S41 family peptidase [Stenotrophomonas maltophilia group]|uniref:S41 family peptidase n=1 Tax=Stenotrophomonas maltophilia group TaxID=995085 RepID=UPI000F66B4D9|nr:S41 family peptidase [Stenotrophomonas maltophilia]RRU69745.1 peptidase [Stenotrophomonas maltophilia]